MAALLDIVKKGSTDRSVTLRVIDSTDGTPEAPAFNTAGVDLWYRREGAAKVSITEVTLAALTTAHTDGGFLHVANGECRLDLPDAAIATGANYCDVGGSFTGMVVIGGRLRLVDYDPEVAVPTAAVIVTALMAKALNAACLGLTVEQVLGILLSAEAGRISGADPLGPGPLIIRNLLNTANVISSAGDGVGNRTSVTVTPP